MTKHADISVNDPEVIGTEAKELGAIHMDWLSIITPPGSEIDELDLSDNDIDLFLLRSHLEFPTSCHETDLSVYDSERFDPDTPEPETDSQVEKESKSRLDTTVISVGKKTMLCQQPQPNPTVPQAGCPSENEARNDVRPFPSRPLTTTTTGISNGISRESRLALHHEYQIVPERTAIQVEKEIITISANEVPGGKTTILSQQPPSVGTFTPPRNQSKGAPFDNRLSEPSISAATSKINGDELAFLQEFLNFPGMGASLPDMNIKRTKTGHQSLSDVYSFANHKDNSIVHAEHMDSEDCKVALQDYSGGMMTNHIAERINNRGITLNVTPAHTQCLYSATESIPVRTDLYDSYAWDYYNTGMPYPTKTTSTNSQMLNGEQVWPTTSTSYAQRQQQGVQRQQQQQGVQRQQQQQQGVQQQQHGVQRQQQQQQQQGVQRQQQQQGALQDTNYVAESHHRGFNVSCVLPTDAFKKDNMVFSAEGPSIPVSRGRVPKRRRSVSAVDVKQPCQGSGKSTGANVIPKLENDTTGYRYFLETPISTTQRIEEDKITYLNKGQFYGLTLDCQAPDRIPGNSTVRSVIMVVFRDNKTIEDEMKAWEFWHSRQHSVKQRIIDIDTKNSCGIVPNSINEVAYNAVSVKWRPREGGAKIKIAINCLGTDFSYQKGVKGLPLHLQIDTFESVRDTVPQHRGYNQVKIFCDKGADRKTRDEERRKAKRAKNGRDTGKKQEEIYHPPSNRSEFYTMAETETIPVLFKPTPINGHVQTCGNDDGDESNSPYNGEADDRANRDHFPACKRQRRVSYGGFIEHPIISLYVKEPHEKGFTALMVKVPTLHGLLQAVEEKYGTPVAKVRNTYKKSKIGFLIKMDDNMVRHFIHESTVMIDINQVGDDNIDITLLEIDP